MGWSLWQIQFMGRWAASTVVDYVEDAMAELTSTWSSSSGSHMPEISIGNTDSITCPALSDRVEKLEVLLSQFSAQQEPSSPQLPVVLLNTSSSFSLAMAGNKVHKREDAILEWPRTLWVTACGWRCGANTKLRILPKERLEQTDHERCMRPGCWSTRWDP